MCVRPRTPLLIGAMAAFVAGTAGAWQSGQAPDLVLGARPNPGPISGVRSILTDPVSGKLFVATTSGQVLRYAAAYKTVPGAVAVLSRSTRFCTALLAP